VILMEQLTKKTSGCAGSTELLHSSRDFSDEWSDVVIFAVSSALSVVAGLRCRPRCVTSSEHSCRAVRTTWMDAK
jgi:hypothetical protein